VALNGCVSGWEAQKVHIRSRIKSLYQNPSVIEPNSLLTNAVQLIYRGHNRLGQRYYDIRMYNRLLRVVWK